MHRQSRIKQEDKNARNTGKSGKRSPKLNPQGYILIAATAVTIIILLFVASLSNRMAGNIERMEQSIDYTRQNLIHMDEHLEILQQGIDELHAKIDQQSPEFAVPGSSESSQNAPNPHPQETEKK